MIIILLILHGVMAMLLLGAVSHQCIAAWTSFNKPREGGFFASLGRVRPEVYTNSVIALYVLTFCLGAVIYPDFRVDVRSTFDLELPAATGGFEIKEHFSSVGLGLLPAYWYFWKLACIKSRASLKIPALLTGLLTLISWTGFLIGHLLNNIEGLS